MAQLVKAYVDGETIAKITARFHVDQTTVQKHVREAGLPRRVNRITPSQVEKAVELYQAGRSIYAIASELAVGYGTVQRALQRHGVTLSAL